MFTRILMCVYLIFFSIVAIADDFRGFDWGASLAQVKKTEKAEFVGATDDVLLYSGSIADVNVSITYLFLKGRLVRGVYSNLESHSNQNSFISDFQSIKNLLQKKYGTPTSDKQGWDNDLYKDDPSQWGMAISVGHLKYVAQWKKERTTITTGLLGDDYKISHSVIYTEEASYTELNSIAEKEALEQL